MNREICGQCGQSLDPNWIDERLPKLEAMLHETTRERDSLRQHLHDEHQRHVGTMEERDALQADLAAARARVEKLEGAEEDRDEYQRQAKLYAERCAESDMELAAARALLGEVRESWIKVGYGASHEDVAECNDFCKRIDAALAGERNHG